MVNRRGVALFKLIAFFAVASWGLLASDAFAQTSPDPYNAGGPRGATAVPADAPFPDAPLPSPVAQQAPAPKQPAESMAGAQAPESLPDGGGPNIGDTAEESDPLQPFNESMFTFNRKLDDYVIHPLASGYAAIVPVPGRQAVGRFFDNLGFIPRTVDNALQLKMIEAGGELGRFMINTTLGLAGFFDVADDWFGMKQHYQDFGLTMGHYGVGMGPYLMLPFFGPSSVRDAVGLAADSAMNPMGYFLPWYITLSAGAGQRFGEAVNTRSLNLELFEEADRYAVDLYGAVQDAYIQNRKQLQK